ncbi:MAG: flagellar protein FliS [Candidatus Acidiferrum sp.]|jgi:flagellar biosynthetic protein FliS
MSSRDAAFSYHHSAAVGASAVGQVVALYDAILRDLRLAMAAVEAGNIENRVNASNHALLVLGELQGVLDFARGGEPAQNLSAFYTAMRDLIVQASISSSQEKFLDLIAKFARLRAAWSHVERSVAPTVPTDRLRISTHEQRTFSPSAAPAPESAEESGSSKWHA